MSDYQACKLLSVTAAKELVVRATLVHPDSALPLPTDTPTLLRLLCEGAPAGFAPALDFHDDGAVARASDAFIECVEVDAVAAAPRPACTYRIRLTRPELTGMFAVGAAWGAAAEIPPQPVGTPPFGDFLEIASTFRRGSRKPAGTAAQRLAMLRRVLQAEPEQAPIVAACLGTFGTAAWDHAADLSRFVYRYAYVAPELARIGNPIAIAPLVLGLVHSDSATRWNDANLHDRILVALGWLGAPAKRLAGPALRAPQPETVQLQFARWRVLGDDAARAALVKAPAGATEQAVVEQRVARNELLFEAPCSQLGEILDGVRRDLCDERMGGPGGESFATLEGWALEACRTQSARPPTSKHSKASSPGRAAKAPTRAAVRTGRSRRRRPRAQ